MTQGPETQRLEQTSFTFLWLFAGVTLLSIAAQNFFFVAAGLGLAAAWKQGSLARWLPRKLILWSLPLLLLTLLASLLSENQEHSIDTWKKWLLMAALWWTPAMAVDERRLRSLLGALLFFSAIWALGASLIALSGPTKAWLGGEALESIAGRWAEVGEWRAVSGSGGYMVMGTGCMLLLALYTALAVEDPDWRKPLPLACLLALGLGLLLTQTRGAWFGAALAVVFLLLARRPRWLWIPAVLAAGLLAWPQSPVRERLTQSLDMSRDSTRERVYMAQAGLSIVREHPWLGVGDAMESWPGHAGYYRRYMPEAAKVWGTTRDQEHGHLHNNFIQIAAMYGLPALAALLALFVLLARSALLEAGSASPLRRGLGWGGLAVMLAWWLNGMVEFNFGSFQSSFTLWFLMGLTRAGAALPGVQNLTSGRKP